MTWCDAPVLVPVCRKLTHIIHIYFSCSFAGYSAKLHILCIYSRFIRIIQIIMNVHRRFVQISMQLALDIYAIAAYNYDIKNNHDFYGGREYEKDYRIFKNE